MFNAEIIIDADQLNKVVNRYKDIPVVSHVTQQQVWDNYYQVRNVYFWSGADKKLSHILPVLKAAKWPGKCVFNFEVQMSVAVPLS